MNTYQPTFMLLPDTSFLPGRGIQLGTLLPAELTSKYPDARRPLNSTSRVPVAEEAISRQAHKAWYLDTAEQTAGRVGLLADLSVIPILNGGISGSRAIRDSVKITAENLDVEWFSPDESYIAQATASTALRKYAGTFRRKPLYLVTGLMTASAATIEYVKDRSEGLRVDLAADGAAVGMPGRVGPIVEGAQVCERRQGSSPVEPFLLAYQLLRIRFKRQEGAFETRMETKWALAGDEDCNIGFNDEADVREWAFAPVLRVEDFEDSE
ncbi:hypothetical protein B0A48_16584 [Cryoendolithus antarcticus]|uniref:Uncharacterized protein n=1 Tax=Cryoendolithus antarcticus TaxID=1507870 RepID=A0A1V8SE58_9PEZI|nr:hypothetical protein B0A48_16584 [Cryoendolithus antarcticus]